MDEYALQNGHNPAGSWILIVHVDGTSDITYFDKPEEMWCCDLAPLIKRVLRRENRKARAEAVNN